MKKSIYCIVSMALAGILFLGTSGHAQVALDDSYGVPFGEPLVVGNPGVFDNATGGAAAAVLITPPLNGTLECVGGDDPSLCDDGSFTYTPDPGFFIGSDTFTYVANDVAGGPISTEVTVTLTACTGGPQIFSCWEEASYLAKLGELGYGTFQEGFENDTTWGPVREPGTALSVTSRGIQWETNHPDPPAANEITTGMGPARTGLWGIYDSDHGYATGNPVGCDIDNPPESCLYYDGFTGIRQAGLSALHGAGGFITGFTGANLALILDGDVNNQIGLGKLPDSGHHFFGVIDAGVSGFTEFEFRELDGKVGQIRIIFGDDFTFASLCGNAADCDDGNDCTDDACAGNVCQYTSNTNPCDDGLFCNGADTCNGGSCSAHAGFLCPDDGIFCNGTEGCDDVTDQCVSSGDPCLPRQCVEVTDSCEDCFVNGDCDDFNECTDDICTAAVCANPANTAPCDDGLFCNGADTCSGGSCSAHAGFLCPDDGLFCNGTEGCDEGSNSCIHSGNPCSGRVCNETTDLCDTPPVPTTTPATRTTTTPGQKTTSSTTTTSLRTTTSSVPATSSILPSTTTIPAPLPTTSTTTTTVAPCLSELLYGEYSEEVEILRYMRDNVLNQTPPGREIIRVYYQWNSIIVKAIENDTEFEEEVKEIIDEVLMLIREEVNQE